MTSHGPLAVFLCSPVLFLQKRESTSPWTPIWIKNNAVHSLLQIALSSKQRFTAELAVLSLLEVRVVVCVCVCG